MALALAIPAVRDARASWEWAPEFQSINEIEPRDFEGPSRFASEYSSDLLSYLKPAEWEYEWLESRNAFDLSVGSLSASEFQLSNRLKLNAQLSDSFEFRFLYTEERDRERDSTHHILEVVYKPLEKLQLSFYGEPSLNKREDDTGIAALYVPSTRHAIRVFQTWVDVNRVTRNNLNDNFIEPFLPRARGLVGRLWSDPATGRREFVEYALRYEPETRWTFPDERFDYRYWKAFGSLWLFRELIPGSEGVSGEARVQFDRKFEEKTAIDPSSPPAQSGTWKNDRLLTHFRASFRGLGPNGRWTVSPGLEFSNRAWLTDQGDVIYRDILPSAALRLPGFGSGPREGWWNITYMITWHRAFGPIGLRDPQDADKRLEQRINFAYEWSFAEQGSLLLMATGDIDKFFTAGSWDGGAGLLRLRF